MSDIGIIPVDFEDRFDPKRMIRERLARAKEALKNSDCDALFCFRTEDARYLMGYRHHLGPAFIMSSAVRACLGSTRARSSPAPTSARPSA
jgi:Xaa-Pro aminopeptidase